MHIRIRRRPVNDYQPITARRRALLAGLAVATAVFIFWLMLERPGAVFPPRPDPATAPDKAACQPGTAAAPGCIGGKLEVHLLPAAAGPTRAATPAASTPRQAPGSGR